MAMVYRRREDGRADVELHSMTTTKDVFWSPRWASEGGGRGGCNSYILMESPYGEFIHLGIQCSLVSVNGIGEIRWSVSPNDLERDQRNEKEDWRKGDEYGEKLKAARHFGLIPT